MSKFEYTDEMVARMEQVSSSGVTEEVIQTLCDEFEFPRRSVTAKLRKLGFDVPKKPGAAPVFSAEEIATTFADGNFTARQINGKALSLEMTQHVKPAEKKVTPKTYTPEEESTISSMVSGGSYLEEIADAVGKTVASVRGKLLSMGLKAPQRDKKASKSDPYEGIENLTDQTVDQLAEHFDKTVRGVKTVLTRRGLSAADYTPKAAE